VVAMITFTTSAWFNAAWFWRKNLPHGLEKWG